MSGPSILAFALVLLAGVAATITTGSPWPAVVGVVAGVTLMFSLKVANQWERAVVLRFGNFQGLKGPGLFVVVPIVDQVSHLVDQRVRVTDVSAESALTKDTVPVNVDAIVFWTVWDAQKAVLEVADYLDAIALSAQTALRETIGRHQLAEMITEREQLGKQLQTILDEKTNPWGITVQSVEIRDVKIPADLEDAMSRQAQAERERQARIILGTAETEIAERFVDRGRRVQGPSARPPPARDEHALRGDQGEGLDGHRAVERRRDDGPRRALGHDGPRAEEPDGGVKKDLP